MDWMEKGLEQRVWQRVRGEGDTEERAERYCAILLALRENLEDYWYLLRRGQSAGIRWLAQEEQRQILRLQGICRMCGEPVPKWSARKKEEASSERILMRCYQRNIRCMKAFGLWEKEERFRSVYSGLVRGKENQCDRILSMMGQIKD